MKTGYAAPIPNWWFGVTPRSLALEQAPLMPACRRAALLPMAQCTVTEESVFVQVLLSLGQEPMHRLMKCTA